MKLLVPPPLVALACALMMWAIATWVGALRVAFPFQQAAAFGLMGVGVVTDLVSIGAFRKAGTTVTPLAPQKASSLVVSGLYRFTRNPMYLGLLLILIGIAVLLGSLVNAVILAFFVVYITAFQIKPEEERLVQIFGQDYLDYTRKVRRWL